MLNDTLKKFNYPETLIKNYENWILLTRTQQVTLGSLILINKSENTQFSKISKESFTELKIVIEDVESALMSLFGCVKINYLMLMLIDPQVHYHIIPRYDKEIIFENITFKDYAWPTPPDMKKSNATNQEVTKLITLSIKKEF